MGDAHCNDVLMRLIDRVVLVTGGASGIGLATARLARDEGAWVFVADIRHPPLAGGEDHDVAGIHFIDCDITDRAATDDLLIRIAHTAGTVNVLVNNAGVLGNIPWDRITPESWTGVMRVNVDGPFFLTQAVLARFPRVGAIVNVASTSAFVVGRDQLAYEASKAAVVMMTRSLAVALAPAGVRVNTVAPGLVDTPLTRTLFGTDGRFDARVREKVPLGRAARPSDIAQAIVFLASDDAGYMTGETLVVDGGWLLV